MKKSKVKERSPAMQFYFRQFAGDQDVMGMDLDSVGAHILLMCAAGASDEGYRLAYDLGRLRVRLRNPSELDFTRIMAQLLAGPWKLSSDGQWIVQEGMKRILLKQKQFQDKQRANAGKRWAMPDACQTDAKGDAKGDAKRCSSSSSTSTYILDTNVSNNIYAPHVRMTEKDFQTIQTEHGEPWAKDFIQKVSDYQASTGKRYKNFPATARTWKSRETQQAHKSGQPFKSAAQQNYDSKINALQEILIEEQASHEIK